MIFFAPEKSIMPRACDPYRFFLNLHCAACGVLPYSFTARVIAGLGGSPDAPKRGGGISPYGVPGPPLTQGCDRLPGGRGAAFKITNPSVIHPRAGCRPTRRMDHGAGEAGEEVAGRERQCVW